MTRLVLACLLAAPAAAAAQRPSAAHQAELKKLDFLVGKWAGPASVTAGPQGKTAMTQTEVVESRLGGTVLLIEGTGRGKPPGKAEEGVVFNALAVISYDADAGTFKIRAHRMEGTSVEADLTVAGKGFKWGFKDPKRNVEVRYVMTLTDKGEWRETGEFSLDGATWRPFFEMTLTRVKE